MFTGRCGREDEGEVGAGLSSIAGQLIAGPVFPSLSSSARRALCLRKENSNSIAVSMVYLTFSVQHQQDLFLEEKS